MISREMTRKLSSRTWTDDTPHFRPCQCILLVRFLAATCNQQAQANTALQQGDGSGEKRGDLPAQECMFSLRSICHSNVAQSLYDHKI